MSKINVIIYGCGVMGRLMTKALLEKKSFKIVGAVDVDPALIGRDLGELLSPRKKLGVRITSDAPGLFSGVNAQAVVLTTTSHLKSVLPQIEQCLKARLNVISTCEELSYPCRRSPGLTRKIDDLARKYGVTVVGTGINPGYLMDTLPLTLTAPCLRVDSIRVKRMMDSSKRRIPFQAKVGTGLTQKEFRRRIDNKIITGHVGLLESINMIADGLGWVLDKAIEFPPVPVITRKRTKSGLGVVEPGKVVGLISRATAKSKGKDIITLEFIAHANVRKQYDEIIVKGVPNIRERIEGGVHGDIGTVAVTINTIPRAVEAAPGLVVMKDLPPAIATS
jgi:4-hydroxy-tetrahydrodipicolinate reductase